MSKVYSPHQTNVLQLPCGKGDGSLFSLDLTRVDEIENRVEEVKRSNPMTYPDLVVEFNMGMARLGDMIALVENELEAAEERLETAKAIAIIERIEEKLLEKKIKSSADIRGAMVQLDPDVIKAKDGVQLLKSALKFLQNKYSTLERAYFSSKTVADFNNVPLSTNFGGNRK